MNDSAAKAIRQKKDSSISRSVDLVKNGSAHAVVSAGHTGAAVSGSFFNHRTFPGNTRPPGGCLIPNQKGVIGFFCGGANNYYLPQNFIVFGILSTAFDVP